MPAQADWIDVARLLNARLWDRDSIGDAAIAGDIRWAGSFGVNVDLVARSHCSVEMITLDDMQVMVQHFHM